jgi:putative redox protein
VVKHKDDQFFSVLLSVNLYLNQRRKIIMPIRERIIFENKSGIELAAALELPDRPTNTFALFAHCFTCGKDIAAASRIARTLASNNIGVLRFDFTGLGGSDGDFSNTNFSSNIEDLLSAAQYLRDHYTAPQLLVGHSLGGTAALNAAGDILECKAVITIGAPATADHVMKLFARDVTKIKSEGSAEVNLAGRHFHIKQQFISDLKAQSIEDRISKLHKALLIFHSPQDDTVSIEQARLIFTAAKHPKSFITLDGADHLLSKIEDAQYVANTISAWASRYIDQKSATPPKVRKGEIIVSEGNYKFLREISSDNHQWLADEPKKAGGDDLGPDPYEHLLAALGACTSMTMRMYANYKGWPLKDIHVQLEHSRQHRDDCENCKNANSKVEMITRTIKLSGPLDDGQRVRMMEIANRCPVHRTLEGNLRIKTVIA